MTPPTAALSNQLGGFHPGPAQSDWPVYGLVDDVRAQLAALREAQRACALVTLVDVDGPSPRRIGAQMVIAGEQAVAGYVSGGCVEGSLVLLGLDVIATGKPRLVVFGEGSPFMDVKLVCGARIEVLIERVDPGETAMGAVLEAWRAREPIARQTDLETGEASIVPDTDDVGEAVLSACGTRAVRRYLPQTRLTIIGWDPVALALERLAALAGIETWIIRPHGPPAESAGILRYRTDAPAQALHALGLDHWTAVAATTHDLELDHAALLAALPSPAFYVGALGSRRRLADRIGALERAGLSWDAVKRLRSPIGLDIGAATPFEIAASILADVIRARRMPTA